MTPAMGLGTASALVLLVLAGCGSGALPRAAEPAVSPPQHAAPAGRTIHVGSMPEGVAADPRTGIVAVGIRNPDAIALVNGRSGRVLRRLSAPESPRHISLARAGGPFLAGAERVDDLVEVLLDPPRVRTVAVGAFPHGTAAAGATWFVADERGDTISVVRGGRRVATLASAKQPGGLAVGGGHLLVVAVKARVATAYDSRTLKRLGSANSGVGPTHVAAHGPTFFVVDTQGDAVLVMRIMHGRPQIIHRVRTSGTPYGIAIDGRRERLWLTLTATNELAEFELNGSRPPRRIASYPTLRQPNTVAVDAATGRVFIAGRAGDRLQLFDPPR